MDDVRPTADYTRDDLVVLILKAMLTNNELRHDLTKGLALSRGNHAPTIVRIFDLADAIVAEAQRRAELAVQEQATQVS